MALTLLTSQAGTGAQLAHAIGASPGDMLEIFVRKNGKEFGPALVTVCNAHGLCSFTVAFCGAGDGPVRVVVKDGCKKRRLRFHKEGESEEKAYLDVLRWRRVCGKSLVDLDSVGWLDRKQHSRVRDVINKVVVATGITKTTLVVDAALFFKPPFFFRLGGCWGSTPGVGSHRSRFVRLVVGVVFVSLRYPFAVWCPFAFRFCFFLRVLEHPCYPGMPQGGCERIIGQFSCFERFGFSGTGGRFGSACLVRFCFPLVMCFGIPAVGMVTARFSDSSRGV